MPFTYAANNYTKGRTIFHRTQPLQPNTNETKGRQLISNPRTCTRINRKKLPADAEHTGIPLVLLKRRNRAMDVDLTFNPARRQEGHIVLFSRMTPFGKANIMENQSPFHPNPSIHTHLKSVTWLTDWRDNQFQAVKSAHSLRRTKPVDRPNNNHSVYWLDSVKNELDQRKVEACSCFQFLTKVF